ncbi:hypothetical protein [Maritalea myrionectae]|uniref:hypothetical protein n=1 Tax=Maritalea myrionectae TaxID=454601 RepID=UPI0003F5D153|nr:hypothetical protein [Maritalea myrionectae]
MLDQNNAARLKEGVKSLELMTRFALATLALASGVYTYLGVRSLIDGSADLVFFAAIVYSAAVSVGIYAFWTYMMRFLPLMRDSARRGALIAVMGLGSLMIVAMSSWLNAAALAGSAALEQHLAVTLEDYVADLDKAHDKALAAQSLLPDVQRASVRFSRLAQDERQSGALTGTSGSGSVVQLLTQMSQQLDELSASILASRETAATQFEQGSQHLANMRALVSGDGEVQPRADEFAAEALALTGVISSLQETSIAASVSRAAEDLSLGFIAPVADGGTQDLANRQDRVMRSIMEAVAAQSKALQAAAQDILNQPGVPARRFVPLSTPEAVLLYARDFLPSWAGAISIDLLPMVLVLILSVVHSASRREARTLDVADKITAAEMMRAVALFRDMNADLPPEQVQKAIEHAASEKLPTDEAPEPDSNAEDDKTSTDSDDPKDKRDDNITPLRDKKH